MNRPILVCALFAAAAAALGAQEASQSNTYEGTSNPPPDDAITTSVTEPAKPPAGHPMRTQPAVQDRTPEPASQPTPSSVDPATNYPAVGDDGIVQAAPETPQNPASAARMYAQDPDGDIVRPRPARQGEIPAGTTVRVRLLDRLSTATTEKGEAFRSRVASDVYQGSKVLIPAGAEIDGRVVQVSTGRAGGHGSMRLRPEFLALPNGTRYRLHAEITGTPGSNTRVGGENSVVPGSRAKRDSIEYGGAVGGGAITGAVLGGPVGALTGSLVGAGIVTAHLLVSHPQATLETGTVLLFTLTDPLDLIPDQNPVN